MSPLLTIPIKCSDPEKIREILRSPPAEISAYEIWIDQLDLSADVTEQYFHNWKKITKKALLAVCKNPLEQGQFKASDREKIDLLLAAAKGGADYVDVGLHSKKGEIQRLRSHLKKTTLIISHHDFRKTPSESQLLTIVKKMRELGADICKIATFVNQLDGNRRIIELALYLKKRHIKHIIIGMGEKGMITRILSNVVGNELQFVSLESKTAPGQLSLEQASDFSFLAS